jgi:hypothetical protein
MENLNGNYEMASLEADLIRLFDQIRSWPAYTYHVRRSTP